MTDIRGKTAALNDSQSHYRILVGTLYAGENEFEECLASIKRQTYRGWSHFVIRDLPKQEAHKKLYQTFMNRADEFDLFIKVDSDMVIENENLFKGIAARFKGDPSLEQLSIAVKDFFTDQLIPERIPCQI